MPTTHVVKQGENLTRIAKQYEFVSYTTIYDHPSNEAFRQLRPDPNLIYPGDEIQIPDKENLIKVGYTGGKHKFTVKKPDVDKLRIQVMSGSGHPFAGKKAILEVDDQIIETVIGDDGILEAVLPKGSEDSATLKVFLNVDADKHTHEFKLLIGHLDPLDTLEGVQARCNLLGFFCGKADGIMGEKTRAGVKAFQEAHDLVVDGKPGPNTKGKLKEVFGY